jgi:hypothetical protein
VPFFDGLMAGEPDALVESFAGEPELHDPVRGRVKGVRAFEAFVTDMNAWLRQHKVSVEDVGHVILERRGFEEGVLHLDRDTGPVDLPVAIVADHPSDGLIDELRIYFSSWALTGRHASRPPLLQRGPELRPSGVVADYQRALAAGDVDAIVAAFEADGYAREPAGSQYYPADWAADSRLFQPWKSEWSPEFQASRSPGALRSQSGRISRVTARRS